MNASTDKIVTDVRVLAADVEELVRATASQSGEQIAAARHRVQSALVNAREAAIVHGRDAIQSADQCVRAHPWAAIGATAGLGILIGILIGRR